MTAKSGVDRELAESFRNRFDPEPREQPRRDPSAGERGRASYMAGKVRRDKAAKQRDENLLREFAEGVSVAALSAKYLVARGTIRQKIKRARDAGKLPASTVSDPGPRSLEAGRGLGPYLGAPNGSGEDLRGAAYRRAAAIGRQYMANALLRLVEAAELDRIDDEGRLLPLSKGADQRVVIVAVRDYLNRVVGSQPIKDPEVLAPNARKFDPSIYTAEQLAQLEAALRMVATVQAKGEDGR